MIAAHVIPPGAVAIKGKLYYWNMTEHIPNVIFIQPTRRKHPLKRMRFRFVSVKEAHFFGVIQRTIDGKPIYAVTTRSYECYQSREDASPEDK